MGENHLGGFIKSFFSYHAFSEKKKMYIQLGGFEPLTAKSVLPLGYTTLMICYILSILNNCLWLDT